MPQHKQNRQTNLGICIVGCGAMGAIHASCWQQIGEARIVAVVDVLEERAKDLAAACGVDTWYTDYHEAIDRHGEGSEAPADVVSVCVPTHLHPEVARYAAERGKHVLCEKPIALTVESAEAMLEAARIHNVRLGVGFMRRHSPVVAALRAWLGAGHAGRPVLYQARDYREIRPKREMHDANANGGPVIDMGVHLFDLWSYLFDAPPVEVFARGFCFAQGRAELAHIADVAVDTADITVTYASGDVGHFSVCWGLPPGVNPDGIPDDILGPRGYARVSYGRNQQALKLADQLKLAGQFSALHEGRAWETVAHSEQDMYQLEIAAFAHAVQCAKIRTPAVPFPDGEAGIRALRVALAALESIHTGQVVKLDTGS